MATPITSPKRHLLDRYLPAYDVSSSFHAIVFAEADAARTALTRVQPLRRLVAGLRALGVSDRISVTLEADAGPDVVAGFAWRLDPQPAEESSTAGFAAFDQPGHAKIAWSLSVSPDVDLRSVLSITVRAGATDAASTAAFLDAWSVLEPFVEAQTRRYAASVNALAQEIEDAAEARAREPQRRHLQLVV